MSFLLPPHIVRNVEIKKKKKTSKRFTQKVNKSNVNEKTERKTVVPFIRAKYIYSL
jgi:hypothetical protein